jgi:hypothetical protein
MNKFRTAAAIAAILIAGPAMAGCTNWTAIAMFDQAEVSTALAVWSNGQDQHNWTALNVALESLARDRNAALADKCSGQQ